MAIILSLDFYAHTYIGVYNADIRYWCTFQPSV